MKPIQLALIGVALTAALGAGYVMLTMNEPQVVEVAGEPQIIQIETERVLVAADNVSMGTELNPERLAWQEWPRSGVNEGFITEEDRPDAIEEMSGAVARNAFFVGEPIREAKLVRTDSGYLSAILPAGKQAVAIRIAPENAAGGFILPNDYVDVLMTFQNEQQEWFTERVLSNIRVLAIDQVVEEEDGESTQLGETATLELTPDQVEIVSVSTAISNNSLSLALRSVEDSGNGESRGADYLVQSSNKKKQGPIKLIRSGNIRTIRN